MKRVKKSKGLEKGLVLHSQPSSNTKVFQLLMTEGGPERSHVCHRPAWDFRRQRNAVPGLSCLIHRLKQPKNSEYSDVQYVNVLIKLDQLTLSAHLFFNIRSN